MVPSEVNLMRPGGVVTSVAIAAASNSAGMFVSTTGGMSVLFSAEAIDNRAGGGGGMPGAVSKSILPSAGVLEVEGGTCTPSPGGVSIPGGINGAVIARQGGVSIPGAVHGTNGGCMT